MPQKPRVSHASEKPPGISLAHYEITTEPIQDRRYQRLPRHVKEAIERLHDVAQRRPREAIPELRDLITQYPRVPQLYNYLSVAYARAGQRQEAEAVVQENYQRNPEYLFARPEPLRSQCSTGALPVPSYLFLSGYTPHLSQKRIRRIRDAALTRLGVSLALTHCQGKAICSGRKCWIARPALFPSYFRSRIRDLSRSLESL